jgi:hypothetical protein
VGVIFDGKKGKHTDDAPAEGSKSKELHQKDKRGKKGKNPRREAREQGCDGNDAEALAVDPARRGPCFPAVENVFLIFGGPTVDMSSR